MSAEGTAPTLAGPLPAARPPGGRLFETPSKSRWTGRFADPDLEHAYWDATAEERSRRLCTVTLLGTGLLLLFGISDYLTLGAGLLLLACMTGRLFLFVTGALVVAAYRRSGNSARLERGTFAVMLLLPTILCLLIAIQGRGMSLVLPGLILMTLCYYLFVPLPLARVAFASAYGGAAFLATGSWLLDPTPTVLALSTLELVLCNALGGYTALRTQVMSRRHWSHLRELQRRLKFEDLLARQSTRFITLPLAQIDPGIDAALAEIGDFAGADRSYVFEVDHDRGETSCTHEWCRPGIAPGMRQIQRAPHSAFPWGVRQIVERRLIVVGSLDELPPEAAAERAAAAALSVRSLLVVPMVAGGEVMGSVGFHAIRQERRWDADEVGLLRQVGELIASAIVRKRMEQELRERTDALEISVSALERSNSELQQFAYAASHDLKEPLRVISGFSGLLASRYRGRLDPQADEYIGFLTGAASRMHRLITDLLEYSRFDQKTRQPVLCDTGEIAATSLANLSLSLEETGGQVCIGPLPKVEGDPSQLLQLFQNLVGNALKFRDGQAPRVTVDARRDGKHWVFSVADNGIGVDAAHASRIFQPFTRLHNSEDYPGTGLGLAVCKRIVERHHGRIWVEPNPPRGSIFRFTLPAAG